ncbi:hypothetical protein PR048_027585 [Dryococelus australis]|uniref:Uncharacterized protein n=1 Tax=Dryococelus australis TaxID=614101 RepID=A0ABQ9GGX5_9NEOP|nr:hypothetical protein PR048_027585 [Dryococelus australis]
MDGFIVHSVCSKCGNDSSPDDESTLKCGLPVWTGSESTHRTSSSDLSSSEDEGGHESRHCKKDLTTGCKKDFQWICSSSTKGNDSSQVHGGMLNEETRALDPLSPTSSIDNISLDSIAEHRHKDESSSTDPLPHSKFAGCDRKCSSANHASQYHNVNAADDVMQYHSHSNSPFGSLHQGNGTSKLPPQGRDKSSSLDHRRHHSGGRLQRDQKSKSTVLPHSPRYRSPSRPPHNYHWSPPTCCCCESYQYGELPHHYYGSAGRLDVHRHLNDSVGDLNHCCSHRTIPLCCQCEQHAYGWRHVSKVS